MALRPTWQGHLRLSLVSCPVLLYSATSHSADVSFHLINPKTGNRIRMVATDPESGPVDRGDLVKGYEVDRDRYVILTDEEIESVRLDSTRTLDIERFVDVADIDRLYWNDPYYLAPDGKVAAEAFGVIREAMARARRIAVGRLVLHTRERLFALEPRDAGLLAWSLRTVGEVRDADEVFDAIPEVKVDARMVAIATKIIEQQEGPFDPSSFNDRYEDALKALIAEKEEGEPLTRAPEPSNTDMPDLMAALRRSLGGTRAGRAARSGGRPGRRQPAKSAKSAKRRRAR